jgi:hypothetical protein
MAYIIVLKYVHHDPRSPRLPPAGAPFCNPAPCSKRSRYIGDNINSRPGIYSSNEGEKNANY